VTKILLAYLETLWLEMDQKSKYNADAAELCFCEKHSNATVAGP
jgi:hypothetical protein